MASTIITKNSSTASAVPSSVDLVQGELAVNVTDKRLFTEDSGGSVVELGTNPSSLSIAGTAITATATELNTLDGITATTTELNYVDGVTSNVQTQLDAKQPLSAVLTATTASFTTADETKLDGIEAGATGDQTASEILTAILTVDGSGSGLDADTLDGSHATAFATAAQGALADSAVQSLSDLSITATAAELNYVDGVTSSVQTQLDSKLASSSYTAADVLSKIVTVDGTGSGLDADLLDGQHGSYYAPIASPTFTGTVTIPTADINGGAIDGVTIGAASAGAGTFTALNLGDNEQAQFGAGNDLRIYHDGSNSYVQDAGTGDLKIGGSVNITLSSASFAETLANFAVNGANTFYYDNAVKLATTSTGVAVTGDITSTADATFNGVPVGKGGSSVSSNTRVGVGALGSNTAGGNNVAIGNNALSSNTTASSNTAVGFQSLTANTTGHSNVGVGQYSLYNCTTGIFNVGVGRNGLFSLSTGSNNTALGCQYSGGSYSPAFNVTTQSNRVSIGHTGVTNAYVQVAWTVVSDARDKTNFAEVPHGLDFVAQLNPVAYQFRVDRDSEETNGGVRYGFKAQDILALEGDSPVIIDAEDEDKLRYNGEALVPVLVNAIKELKAEIDTLKAQIAGS